MQNERPYDGRSSSCYQYLKELNLIYRRLAFKNVDWCDIHGGGGGGRLPNEGDGDDTFSFQGIF